MGLSHFKVLKLQTQQGSELYTEIKPSVHIARELKYSGGICSKLLVSTTALHGLVASQPRQWSKQSCAVSTSFVLIFQVFDSKRV